ncbi:MAG: tRNA pseudouridine(38-40) synthase TruA [Halanaerobiales bacterium]
MQNIKLTLEYDGTNYSGWQIQKNTPHTIQQRLQEALSRINKKPVKVQGASRTDAGVHAIGQTANCILEVDIPAERIPAALNRLLPSDIICRQAEYVSMNFHARYDNQGKKYRYRILNQKLPSVFLRNYVYHYIYDIDLDLLKEASQFFVGTHDYTSFQASGCAAKNPVKTIQDIKIINKNPEIWFEIKGDGFLYNMVRIIIGTLIELSMGKISLSDIEKILQARDRDMAGFTAPAEGLILLEVYY